MRHFQQLAKGLMVLPLLHSLQCQSRLWNRDDLRTKHPGTAHAEVDDIWLRFQDTTDPEKVIDEHESINYEAWFTLPQAHPLIFDLMHVVRATRLGRVLITRLAPGKRITPHVDGGSHAAYYERYHFALQSLPGAIFRAADEQVQMASGDLWWFDNSVEHEVVNNSADDRIVMIVDAQVVK